MKALILAGGYAVRLWPITKDRPKPLLPVAGKPVIEYLIDKLNGINIDQIVISTNLRFKENFERYLSQTWIKNIELVVEESRSESEKPGAIRALAKLVPQIEDDCLIVAGDNIFTSSLKGFIWRFNQLRASVIGLYNIEREELAKRYSTATLSSEGRILNFYEKPKMPETTMIGTCLYMFPKKTLKRIVEYIDQGLDSDAPGRFIEWLYKKEPVYGYILNGVWYDIGTLDVYQEANRYFSTLPTKKNNGIVYYSSIQH